MSAMLPLVLGAVCLGWTLAHAWLLMRAMPPEKASTNTERKLAWGRAAAGRGAGGIFALDLDRVEGIQTSGTVVTIWLRSGQRFDLNAPEEEKADTIACELAQALGAPVPEPEEP